MERKIYLTSFHSKIYIPPLQGNYTKALPTPVLQLLPPKLRTIPLPPPPSLPITRDHLHPTPLSVTTWAIHSKLKSPLKIKISSLQTLYYPDPTDHSPSPSERHPPQLLCPLLVFWKSDLSFSRPPLEIPPLIHRSAREQYGALVRLAFK